MAADVLNALGEGFQEVNRAHMGVPKTGFVYDEQFKVDIERELAEFEA